MTTLPYWLVLGASASPTPSRDIEAARAALASGCTGVWVGESYVEGAPARLAALAAVVPDLRLGFGLVPVTSRGSDHLEETLSTISLLAPGRASLVFSLPTTLSPLARPGWEDRLAEAAALARRAGVPASAAVHDVETARLAAPHVDRLVLRGVDAEAVTRLRADLVGESSPAVDVWLDVAAADAVDGLAAVVAERLAVPGVPGHDAGRAVARRRGFGGLLGEVEQAYALGLPERAARAVPEDLVRSTCLVVDDLPARLAEYRGAGADGVGLAVHDYDPETVLPLVRAAVGGDCPRGP
ncbi:LLM class flavin-dependent oxidoreductase [Mobilicoccus pelagius]|uniref:Luciferase-like domain-containing protein n=1 Tax=Mobilicoccus pelagius NBRC 104925 TaxID=1089455 RepID=H5UTH7_9MICO|nr:LLM class flavin-dependent oxidoreductase [Mobilicoccus pelagius]GAB49035.1 hypothetical protein MOPEL_096_00420 [Mobilicoccus pelagius NBRC 104925]